MPNWKKVVVSGSDAVLKSVTSSLGIASYGNVYAPNFIGTASYATYAVTAETALNGGVTQIIAGPNISLSPLSGLGQVTISSTGGSGGYNTATGSYGSFYDTTIQTNPVANVPRSMSFNSTDITNGVSISGSTNPFNTYIKTVNAGIYNIQFSAQVEKTDSGTDEIVIWLRKNGIDLTDSATKLTLSGNGTKVVAAWNWFALSSANDYYQIIWVSADTGMRLYAEPINDTPGIPSVILTVNRVDQFLSNTGSFKGSFYGELIGTASYANKIAITPYAVSTPLPIILGSGNSLFRDSEPSDFTYNAGTNRLTVPNVSILTSLTASGLNYPTADGDNGDILTTNGSGNLAFDRPRVTAQVKNAWSSTLPKGTPVYVSSSVGNLDLVKPASASNANTMPALGVLAQDLAPNAEGLLIVVGYINGVNTSAFSAADVVYVGANGGYTNVKPTGTNLIQNLGIVTKVDSSNGSGFVYGAGRSNDLPNIQSGYAWVGNTNGVPVAVPTSSFAGSVTIVGDTNNRFVTANGNGTFTAESILTYGGSGAIEMTAPLRISFSSNRAFFVTKTSNTITAEMGDLSGINNSTRFLVDDGTDSGSIQFIFDNIQHYFDQDTLFVSGTIEGDNLFINNRTIGPAIFSGEVEAPFVTAGNVDASLLTGDWLSSNGANRVITSDGDGTFTAESGLTYTTGILSVTGRVNATSFTGSLRGTASAADRVLVNATTTDQYYTVPFIQNVNSKGHAAIGYESSNVGIRYNPSRNTIQLGHVSASALTVTESFNITGRQYPSSSYHLIEVPRGQMYTQGIFFVTSSFPADQASPTWKKMPLLKFPTGSSLDLDMIVHIIPDENDLSKNTVFRQNSTIAAIRTYPIISTFNTWPFETGEYTLSIGPTFPTNQGFEGYIFLLGFNTSDTQSINTAQVSDEETVPVVSSASGEEQGPILLSFVTGSNGIDSSYLSMRLLLSSNTYSDTYLNYIENAKINVTCNYKLIKYA
jgi:hypothetical protein